MPEAFVLGDQYTRQDVLRALGFPADTKGGPWITGYSEHQGAFYVFANVGSPGRTGHDYQNVWLGNKLRWFAKTGTSLDQPQMRKLLEPGRVVRVFWRDSDRAPFTFAGEGEAYEAKAISPVEVTWSFP